MANHLKLSVNFTALALASGLIMSTAADAADLAPPPPAYAPPPTISWGGIYLGGHIGAGDANWNGVWNNLDTSSAVFFGDFDTSGVLGGVHAGFNWDIDTFVLGLEGDVSFMDWDGLAKSVADSEEATAEVDMLASIRARLGMPMGADRRVMPYVTGGVAWADAEATLFEEGRADDDIDTLDKASLDFDDVGGVVGAGVEYAVTEAFRVRGESLFYFFNDKKKLNTDIINGATTGDFIELDDAWTVRVGGSWHFTTPGF
ncbi:MAG: outer membrane protein [Hyphomicrobiales bacterium]